MKILYRLHTLNFIQGEALVNEMNINNFKFIILNNKYELF